MQPDRWREIEALFQLAIERPTGDRAAFIAEACGPDVAMFEELRYLVECHEEGSAFLEGSVVEELPRFLQEDDAAPEQSRVGPYRIIRQIGHGGMGAVYLAERSDDHYRKNVAIKLVRGGLDSTLLARRFRNERQILANLNHPNIARLFDGGTTNEGVPYLVMEYVDGEPVDKYCDNRKLPTSERLKLFRTVCAAVQYAHQNLVIHRDIKPSNILVTSDGTPKLLDFGIAKLIARDSTISTGDTTAPMQHLMTPDYASPEQVRGESITTASDIYSLGVLLYGILTGRQPYQFKSQALHEVARTICETEPERPSKAIRDTGTTPGVENISRIRDGSPKKLRVRLAGDVDNILLKALNKRPEMRYASVERFSEDIQRHLEGMPVIARKDTLAYRGGKFIRRHLAAVIASVLILLTLVVGLAVTLWQWSLARAQQVRAESRLSDVLALADSLLFKANDAIAGLPNSTQARMTLVRDALNSLDGFSNKDVGSPALQRELAAAYLKIGDIQGKPYTANVGDSAGALRSYSKAAAILENLSAASPQDSETKLALSNAYDAIGNIRTRAVEYDEAVRSHLKALAIREQLAMSVLRNSQYQRLVALSCMHIGDPLQYQGRSSYPYYKRALDILESLAARKEEDAEGKQERGRASHRVGASFEAAGDRLTRNFSYERAGLEAYRGALGYYRKAREIAESLAATDPADTKLRRSAADSAANEGKMLSDVGDSSASLKLYREALTQFISLSVADPHNTELRFDVFNTHLGMARAFQKAGETADAFRSYEKAIQIGSSMHRKDPSNYELTVYLLSAYTDLAALLAGTGDIAGAIRNTRLSVSLSKEMHTGYGQTKEWTFSLRLAVLLIRSGDSRGAERLASDVLSGARKAAERPGGSADDLGFYSNILLTVQPAKLRDAATALVNARLVIKNTKTADTGQLLNLAWALYANHEDAASIDVFCRALDLLPYPVHDRDPTTILNAIDKGLAAYNSGRKR